MEATDLDDTPGQIVKQPELTWEEGSHILSDITKTFPLPVVVQYDWQKHPIPFNQFNFDLSQPLLLYKRRNIQKVPATSLTIQDDTYVTVGESLLIPEDYKGWFAVLQRSLGSGTSANDVVPHFSTVEELASSNTDRFLIGGTTKIIGLQILERSESHLNHEQRPFLPGELLAKGKIYYGETKKKTRLFRKPKYITEKFLMCTDESDHEILLPFTQKGIFYQVSVISGKPNRNVMQMSDIVAKKLPPRILKLVYGQFPKMPCSFTGLMRAEQAKLESSLLAATLVNRKNILLELPLDTPMYFRVAHCTDDVKKNQCFLNAMKLCSEKATTYMRNIKVSINFSNEDEKEALTIGPSSFTRHKILVEMQSGDTDVGDSREDDDEKEVHKSDSPLVEKDRRDETDSQRYVYYNGYGGPPESPYYVNTSPYCNMVYPEAEEKLVGKRLSEDIHQEVQMRPSRCRSMGHVSFCLGNGYLTVPIFANDLKPLQESTETTEDDYVTPNVAYDKQQEEDNNDSGVPEDEIKDLSTQMEELNESEEMPVPKPCMSYVNVPSSDTPTPGSNKAQNEPAFDSTQRRPSTKPPNASPPPIPKAQENRSSSSSVTSDDVSSKRSSSESGEYDVPKVKEPRFPSPSPARFLPVSVLGQGGARRPSTFTFSEGGGLGFQRILPANDNPSNRTSVQSVSSTEEGGEFEEGPVYANITGLKELQESGEYEFMDHKHQQVELVRSYDENKGESSCSVNDTSLVDDQYQNVWETEGTNLNSVKPMTDNHCDADLPLPVIEEHTPTSQTDTPNIVVSQGRFPVLNVDEMKDSLELPTNASTCISNRKASNPETISTDGSDDVTADIPCRLTQRTSDGYTSQHLIQVPEKELSKLSVEELAEALHNIGLRQETVEHIRHRTINGKDLATAESDDQTLKDFLPEVRLLEVQKLSMFIRGWRPHKRERATDTV